MNAELVPAGDGDDEPVLVDPPKSPRTIHGTVIAARDAQRRPIVPAWARNRRDAQDLAAWLARYGAHVALYHLTRLPKYTLKLLLCVPLGIIAAVVGTLGWVFDREGAPLRVNAVHRNDPDGYLKLAKVRDARVRRRGAVAGAGLAVLIGAVLVVWWSPRWVQVPAVALAVVVLGRLGRPADVRITDPALVNTAAPPRLTADTVTRALRVLGISAMNSKGAEISYPAPITRDGPGWRADVDLPYGVTPQDVMEKRRELASGLRRPLGCVWPEPARDQHAGRLVLWVGDTDLSKTKQPGWPLAKTGRADLFTPVPFGTDQRGRLVSVTLMFASMVVGSVPRMGKALALDTPVPTPTGWATMGELQDGDLVFDDAGAPCRVVAAHAVQYGRPCFEVEFSDGSVVVADAEHLWQVETRSGRVNNRPEKVLTTAEMVAGDGRVEADRRVNYSIRTAGALHTPDAELPIGPYTLGAWLGDGTTTTGMITNPEVAVIANIQCEGETITAVPSTIGDTAPGWRISGLSGRLRDVGVLGRKHIPAVYLRASERQRRALLAGLLDTDGWCEKAGGSRFSVTSEQLARDVRALIATLGYVSTLRSRPARLNGRDCGTSWEITFCPDRPVFRVPRKAVRQSSGAKPSNRRRFITDIRPVASVPVRCITVDSPSSLYLVGEQCIPTHNTFSLRLLLLAAALDPIAELHLFDLKGTGDLSALAPVAHAYRAGDDVEDIDYALADMRALQAELRRRTKVIRELPRTLAPESKITRELAEKRSLGLWPVVLGVDECQRWFEHPDHGKELTTIAEDLVRRGPAAGITAIFATQRPDAKSIPTGISGNAILRFCLKVMDHVANDQVLGTSAHKNGIKATIFSRRDLGIGYLAGEEDDPQITRTYYVDSPAAEAVVARARATREAAGTLSGYALAEATPADEPHDLLADVRAVFAAGMVDKLWHEDLLARLLGLRPDVYAGWDVRRLGAELRDAGVPTRQIAVTLDGERVNRNGTRRVDVDRALEPAGTRLEIEP